MNIAITIYIIGVILAFFMLRKGHLSEENRYVSRFEILVMIMVILASWLGALVMVLIDPTLFLGKFPDKWHDFWNKETRL